MKMCLRSLCVIGSVPAVFASMVDMQGKNNSRRDKVLTRASLNWRHLCGDFHDGASHVARLLTPDLIGCLVIPNYELPTSTSPPNQGAPVVIALVTVGTCPRPGRSRNRLY